MTIEQRRQAIDFGKIRGTGMPVPPLGLLSAPQRAHVLNVYYEVPVPPAPFFFWRNRNFVSTLWAPKVTPQDGSTQVIE